METLFAIVAVLSVGAAIVTTVGTIRSRRRRQRERGPALVTALAPLGFSPSDTTEVPLLPPRLLGPAVDGRAEHVQSNGSVVVFDWTWSTGRARASANTFVRTCACVPVAATCPHLVVRPRAPIVAEYIEPTELPVVHTESDELAHRYDIRCADDRFATAALDAGLIGWLLDVGGPWEFALHGRWLLVTATPFAGPPRLDDDGSLVVARVPDLVDVARGFAARIPPVVGELYP